ncbi:MAG TPA: putative quinol monooxygenase [Woeseiaceae bacterium]|nr:putative quinol monooxygenase [Woeseiaceae bacterium]
MRSDEVTVLIRMRLRPESVEQGKSDLLDLARRVMSVEQDCLAIELAQDMDDDTKITMIEKWSTREAYEGPHMRSPHMQAFIEQSAGYFVGPPDISFCRGTVVVA